MPRARKPPAKTGGSYRRARGNVKQGGPARPGTGYGTRARARVRSRLDLRADPVNVNLPVPVPVHRAPCPVRWEFLAAPLLAELLGALVAHEAHRGRALGLLVLGGERGPHGLFVRLDREADLLALLGAA